jgi:hypothetical protein
MPRRKGELVGYPSQPSGCSQESQSRRPDPSTSYMTCSHKVSGLTPHCRTPAKLCCRPVDHRFEETQWESFEADKLVRIVRGNLHQVVASVWVSVFTNPTSSIRCSASATLSAWSSWSHRHMPSQWNFALLCERLILPRPRILRDLKALEEYQTHLP